MRKAAEEGHIADGADPALLQHPAEKTLLRKLLLLPEAVEKVVDELAPHHLPHYAQDVASAFDVFYTQCRVIDPADEAMTSARLLLLDASRSVLARTLGLMGVTAPDQM